MIQKITLFLLVFCLALGFMAVSSARANIGLVSVDSTDAQLGEQVAIPIVLSGLDLADTMYAYSLFIKFDDASLDFDSVSFIGALAREDATKAFYYFQNEAKVSIVTFPALDSNISVLPIFPSNGLLATMYFHVSPLAGAGYHKIDSSFNQVCFADTCYTEQCTIAIQGAPGSPEGYLETVLPDFESGGVYVKIPTGINDGNSNVPDEFSLNQNYPNPFNPSTVIEFSLPTADNVKLNVYNILGQEIEVLASGPMTAGRHEVTFNGDRFPSGIYFYRLRSTSGTETRKMILTK